MMELIRRVFNYLSPAMFRALYSTFVRCNLEYAQVVWSPRYKSLEDKIEHVQVRATKQVDGLRYLNYSERLRLIKIPTLKYSRLSGDMLERWKHFNIYKRRMLPITFKPLDRPSRRLQQLFHHHSLGEVYGVQSNSFYYRTISLWNELPSAVAEATSFNSFKNRVGIHWKDLGLGAPTVSFSCLT